MPEIILYFCLFFAQHTLPEPTLNLTAGDANGIKTAQGYDSRMNGDRTLA
jgi:hypothetical protein